MVSESHQKGSQNAIYVHNRYAGLHDEGRERWEQEMWQVLHGVLFLLSGNSYVATGRIYIQDC